MFSKLNIASKDSTNLQLNALKIYQNLIRFHQNDKSSNAFVAVNIERLNFVKQHATFGNVDDAFIKTLQIEDKDTNGKSSSALYNYELANLLSQKGSTYNAKKPETVASRWQFKDALQICESVINKYPKSSGAKKCKTLKARIIKPDLGLITEKHIPLNSESLILVNYKNLDALTFNIYKVSFNQLKKYNSTYRTDDREKFIKKLNVHKTFSSTLINEKDYQVHSLEVVLPALDNGLYLVVAKTETDVFSTADIQVTDMALLETQETSSINLSIGKS